MSELGFLCGLSGFYTEFIQLRWTREPKIPYETQLADVLRITGSNLDFDLTWIDVRLVMPGVPSLFLRCLYRHPQKDFEPDDCKAAGDVIVAHECPDDAALVTKNKKHFEPICHVLNKQAAFYS